MGHPKRRLEKPKSFQGSRGQRRGDAPLRTREREGKARALIDDTAQLSSADRGLCNPLGDREPEPDAASIVLPLSKPIKEPRNVFWRNPRTRILDAQQKPPTVEIRRE